MKKMSWAALVCAISLMCAPALAADITPAVPVAEAETRSLEPMDVSAVPFEEPPSSPYHLPESVAASVWAIDQSGIQSLEARDLFDVLAYAPGVQISFQGRKGLDFISSRGGGNFIGGSSFAVLIDGAYVPWTQSSRVLASFPLDTIESIRVVRDSSVLTMAPLSNLGGIGTAIQGVIFIKTHKPTKSESRIKASYGNLNRYKAFLNHGDKIGDGYYSLSYNKQHDDGREDWNNASDSDTILLQGGYDKYGLKADASFYYDWATRELQRSLPVSKTYDAKWEYDPLDTLMATAGVSKQWNDTQNTSLLLYTGRITDTVQYRSYTKPTYSSDDQEDNVVQVNLGHVITSGANNFRVGAQGLFWDCPNGQLYYEGYEREEELYSAYVHDEYAFSKALSVDAGARVDWKHITKGINKYSATDATPSEVINDEWAAPNYAVALGTAYTFDPMWQASLRVSFTEQGSDDFLVTVDDKTLDPEKQIRYEAGLIANLHPAVRATATAFYYDLRDMKQAVGYITDGDDIINVYDNVDTARKGVELYVSGYIFIPDFTYGLSYTYQRSDDDTDDEAIPHHLASLRLGYRWGPWQTNVMMRYVSEYDSNQFAADKLYHEIGDFSRLDANISYDFVVGTGQWRATVFAQNLGDVEYQTRLGWEDVGLTYGVELGVKF